MSDDAENTEKTVRGKPWQPGQSGNPGGRPKLTEEEKAVRALTNETWNDLSHKMMTCTRDDLEALLNGADPLPYEAELFIRHMLDLGEAPSWHAYTKYLDRRIGPVRQEIDLRTTPRPVVIERLNGGELVLGTEEKEES